MAIPVAKAVIVAVALATRLAFSADSPQTAKTASAETKSKTGETDAVAAVVNGIAIRASEVNSALASALGGRHVADSTKALLMAETLAQLLDRQLVYSALLAEGPEVTDDEIAAARAQLQSQLAARKMTIEQLLGEQKISEAALRQQFVWQVMWERYAKRHLNDESLKLFFESHRAEYDGTKLRAAHILLRSARSSDADGAADMMKRAVAIRQELVDGKLSFAEAAKKHSDGPSRHEGGDVGLIERRGPMVEAFSRATFALKKGEISQPVLTPFGVHLITVTEVAPGQKSFGECRDELLAPAMLQLFADFAEKLRREAKVEFTGAVPHFKLGTRELVIGKGES